MQREIGSSSRISMKKTPRAEVTKAYHRGMRLVFAPNIVEGTKPTSIEQRSSPQHEAHLHDEEHRSAEQVIMDKDAEIIELKDILSRPIS